MTSGQANALLTLIADLARIIYSQPTPEPVVVDTNGSGPVEDIAEMKVP